VDQRQAVPLVLTSNDEHSCYTSWLTSGQQVWWHAACVFRSPKHTSDWYSTSLDRPSKHEVCQM